MTVPWRWKAGNTAELAISQFSPCFSARRFKGPVLSIDWFQFISIKAWWNVEGREEGGGHTFFFENKICYCKCIILPSFCVALINTLPKFNIAPEKGHFKRKVVLQASFFGGYIC